MKFLASSRALLGAIAILGSASARAAVVDSRFEEETLTASVKQLTSMAWAPDGSRRLFVLQQTGEVLILKDGAVLPTPFAKLAVTSVSECGLLGIAFDPDFVDNGYVYLFVTVSTSEQQIVRYTADGNTGSNPTVIMGGLPTKGLNHDGGALGFGADGKLYWAVGDTAGVRSGVGDDLVSLAAKVGRANRDGSAPPDNPFFDGDGPNNDYIWARGFRNPFSLSFQPSTGQLWLNVVGSVMEQVFRPAAGDNGGWDTYEGNQPAGFLTPAIAYWTNKAPSFVIKATGAVRAGGVVTISTAIAHRLQTGTSVTVAGVTDPSFDDTAIITSVAPTSFSFAQAGADAKSGGGTATVAAIGGALTGGEFWDSTAIPPDYRGNFFFGDYNSGAVMQARLDASNNVTAIEPFASDIAGIVDMALGPDGDLYYGTHAGQIIRTSYANASQAVVVSKRNVRLVEGGRGAYDLRLAIAPTKDVRVSSAWLSGDVDVTVVEGADLTFTPDNWSTPQRVLVAAGVDADLTGDEAKVAVAAPGLASQTVQIWVTDEGGGSDLPGMGGAGGEAGRPGEAGVSGEVGSGGAGGEEAGSGRAQGGEAPLGPDGGARSFGGVDGSGGSEAAAGGAVEASRDSERGSSGCGCLVGSRGQALPAWFGGGLLLGLLFERRRRR